MNPLTVRETNSQNFPSYEKKRYFLTFCSLTFLDHFGHFFFGKLFFLISTSNLRFPVLFFNLYMASEYISKNGILSSCPSSEERGHLLSQDPNFLILRLAKQHLKEQWRGLSRLCVKLVIEFNKYYCIFMKIILLCHYPLSHQCQ